MADNSRIEWTDATWNPITGCGRVSTGCENCYAERLAATRLRNHPSRTDLTDKNGRWNGIVRFNHEWLDQPFRWVRRRRIFVCAHGDLFHENVPDEWIDRVFAVMWAAPVHVFQVLTKRPERMRNYLYEEPWSRIYEQARVLAGSDEHLPLMRDIPLSNVWLGTSVENQATYENRILPLLQTPAVVRWLSIEPLLAEVRLTYTGRRLHWAVIGGESGPSYRPMELNWARSLRDQCARNHVRFFMKQMAGKAPIPEDLMIRQWPREAA